MSAPLVAPVENEDAEPLGNWEGAGVASSWADLNDALGEENKDAGEIAWAALGAGLDTLGAIADPFDSFMSSVAGWLIEHIWFLHEPLDVLAGDPNQISAQAQTWHNVSRELSAVAADQRGAVPGPAAWEGAAGDAYRIATERFAIGLDSAAADAEQLAELILSTGAAVGTVRALIRDLLADFLADLLVRAVAWAASAFVTFGGSLAVGVAHVVLMALDLADGIRHRISQLLDALKAAGGTAEELSDAVRDTVAQVRATAPYAQDAAREVVRVAEANGVDDAIEVGKQFSDARFSDAQEE